jgi:hypothetical protein
VEAIGEPKRTKWLEKESQHKRLVDYAVNVLYVLGFLSVGDGASEAQRLLGLLDLPNLTTMERSTFGRVERHISPYIIALAEEQMKKNLLEEVELSLDNQCSPFHYDLWQRCVVEGDCSIRDEEFARVTAGADMSWQQRRISYDSLSGHALMFGSHTHKPIWYNIKQKSCWICSHNKNNEEGIPEHDCVINHEGSSTSMEPLVVVDMVTDLYGNFHCKVARLVTDDNSTMKANCRWSNKDWKNHYGS